MKKILIAFFLLTIAVILPSCGNKILSEPDSLPAETTFLKEEPFRFESSLIPHGAYAFDLYTLTEEELTDRYGNFMRIRERRPATSREAYQNYIADVCDLFPDAAEDDFPDIPEAWFEDHALLTVLLFKGDGSAGRYEDVKLSGQTVEHCTLYLSLEVIGLEPQLIADSASPSPVASFLLAYDKAEAEGLTGTVVKEYLADAEKPDTDEVTGCTRLDQGAYNGYVTYCEDRDREEGKQSIFMKWSEETGLKTDRMHDDVVFPVNIRLSAAELPSEDFHHALNEKYRSFFAEYNIDRLYDDPQLAADPGQFASWGETAEDVLKTGSLYIWQAHSISCTAPLLGQLLADPRVIEIGPFLS